MLISKTLKPLVGAAALLCASLAAQAATIVVTSRDAAGVGFNDPTPVAPVGGNPGTTLGQQRMNVYQHVANIWGAAIQSDQVIQVSAGWQALTCSSSSAVLGSASAWNLWHDFPGGVPGTWYPQALANKLAHTNLSANQADDGTGYGNVDIKTQFNINLGNTGCLDGMPFYLGLDGKPPGNQVNFMVTLLHEIGHGLGFAIGFTNGQTGLRVNADATAYADDGLPSIWETYMYDSTQGKTWLNMTTAQRKASGTNAGGLGWIGPNVLAAAPQTLAHPGVLQISSPAQATPTKFSYGTATFGTPVTSPMNLGHVVDTASQACTAFTPGSLSGKVAIVDRGTCSFSIKAKMTQDAGAVGTIVVNNAAGAAPGMSGVDATLVTPTVSLSITDGATLRSMVTAAKKYGTRSTPGMVYAATALDMSKMAGADAAGRPLLYTPTTYAGGSSVSHWDVSASPNQLMEPNINADLTTSLVPPLDMTLPLLKDLGW